ncbi:MAG: glycosyltransferase [Prevotella sp.]|nr:glycosyltransferase [Prevotella sp.]
MAKEFSIAMAVYKNDAPDYLRDALKSVIDQTLKPSEIVIVGDGPISEECKKTIEDMSHEAQHEGIDLVFLPQEENNGLGASLRLAVEHCRYDYIARMDADDLALPYRFEKQMKCFDEDPELSIVGGMITEFEGNPENIMDKRVLPLSDSEIKEFMKSRCGVNHVTVIFKKADLLKAGNYNDEYRQEDYYLWARMIKAGCKFRNIPDIVVNVRSGRDQFARRSGGSYYRDHMEIFKYMRREGIITYPRLVYNGIVRGLVQYVFPNRLRTFTYQHMLRKR